jgi:hypothetical protein
VDHPVTVGAQEYEIVESGRALTRAVQRHDVMALDIALTPLAVRGLEVESACCAGQSFTSSAHPFDLLSAELVAALAGEVLPDEQLSLWCIDVVQFRWVQGRKFIEGAGENPGTDALRKLLISAGRARNASRTSLSSRPPLVGLPW